MITEILWFLLLGHLVGDYLFQTSYMALKKKVHVLPCTIHCTVYTMCVCTALVICPVVSTVPYSLMFWIFISHWIFDRYELLDKWFKLLTVRSWNSTKLKLGDAPQVFDVVNISFGSVIYTVADNTLHLILMTGIIYYYYGG